MDSLSREIYVSSPSHKSIKYTRTEFYFTFNPYYSYLDISTLIIDLSFLGFENYPLKNNLRCGLYRGSILSHDFNYFSMKNFSHINITFK